MAVEARGGFSAAYVAAQASEEAHRVTPADAFAAARETYLAGRRLDMRELAENLGVGRTTLYRWCGDRQQLLKDVVWSIAEGWIDQTERATRRLHGRARVRESVRMFNRMVAGDPALKAFLRNETHAALRVVTASGDGTTVHDRVVATLVTLIEYENQREDMGLRARPEIVASTIVRVMESFIYNDAIAAVDPRLDDAVEALDYLLS
jgi:AcrR family transcriptional regulator